MKSITAEKLGLATEPVAASGVTRSLKEHCR